MSHVKLYFSPAAILPQIKSDIFLSISVLVCRFLPHTFSLLFSLAFLTLIYVTKNKRKNSPYHSSFFLFTQYNPHTAPKTASVSYTIRLSCLCGIIYNIYDTKKLSVYQAF